MNNVIKFPTRQTATPREEAPRFAHPTDLEAPAEHFHAVQFYDGEEFLYQTVADFLSAGLQVGDRVLVIATAVHREGMRRELVETHHHDVDAAVASGQLVFIDAREMLAKFMVGGMPDEDLLRDAFSRTVPGTTRARGERRTRAYGELSDVLWRDGNPDGAIRLDELGDELSEEHSLSLLCAYAMDGFGRDTDTGDFMSVCRHHGQVLPAEGGLAQDEGEAVDARMREIAFLQQRARALESEIENRNLLERSLREALLERSRVEEELRCSVRAERQARTCAEASDAFKEIFLGVLGHDLRNPLSTILMTTRTMKMRGELPPESEKRLDRITSSGERMRRMIDQILDVTRARLTDGIRVDRSQERDLVALVSKIVGEIQAVHPDRPIELSAPGPCRARVDADRFEQVVSNLVGNAVTHGDPVSPVEVALGSENGAASLTVRNDGPPIEPAELLSLFNPFQRVGKPRGRSDGLGLGLYISERIVSAHGGTIDVDSSELAGTRFEVTIPLDPPQATPRVTPNVAPNVTD